MQTNWAETGRPVAEFLDLTLRQIDIIIRAYWVKVERETVLQCNLAAYSVWRLANFQRLKRLPKKPDDLLKKKAKSSGPDSMAQKAMIEMLNMALGGSDNRKDAKK